MYAKVFLYTETGKPQWVVNVWEHPGFGATLINSCIGFENKHEALDWLWNESGCHVTKTDIIGG